MSINVLVFEPGGEIREETLDNPLSDLERLVGGYIECPEVEDNRCSVFINESGKLIPLEMNPIGTMVWYALSPQMRGVYDLWGTVVIAGGVDENGNPMSIPTDMRDIIVLSLEKLASS